MTWEELNAHELVVYSTTWCPDCRRIKQQFEAHSITYREIDIDTDAKAGKHLQKQTGRTAIPYVEVDGKCMVRGWHEGSPGRWDDAIFLSEVDDGLAASS